MIYAIYNYIYAIFITIYCNIYYITIYVIYIYYITIYVIYILYYNIICYI